MRLTSLAIPGGAALLLGALVVVSPACHRAAWTTEDSWYTGSPPASWIAEQWGQVPQSGVHAVLPEREENAESLLREVSVVALDPDMAKELAGPIEAKEGVRYCLVRGLCLNCKNVPVRISMRDCVGWVWHSTPGREALPMQRRPLIIETDTCPSLLYVTVSMFE